MNTKPITPDEVSSIIFPDQVISKWNELIAKHYRNGNGKAVVKQNEIVKLLMHSSGCSRDEIFNNGWLDIEEVYRLAGWNVCYVKPDRDENFESYFEFTKPETKCSNPFGPGWTDK